MPMRRTQFWTPEAGLDRFTVHGLWPDRCDGSVSPSFSSSSSFSLTTMLEQFEAFCDNGRNIANPRQILQNGGGQSALNYMDAFWPSNDNDDEGFWSHEWNKHGTCISTMETQCYGSGYINRSSLSSFPPSSTIRLLPPSPPRAEFHTYRIPQIPSSR